MLNESTSPSSPTSQERKARRQQLLEALRGPADDLLERLADELVDLSDDKAFGAIEMTLRDLSHDFATRAHQAGLQAGKKRGIKAPAWSALTARATPASSITASRPG
jgi:hypothetical protein